MTDDPIDPDDLLPVDDDQDPPADDDPSDDE